MGLRQKRTLRAFGLPEFVACVLLVLVLVPAGLWLRGIDEASYAQTEGRILSCDLVSTHYNATDVAQKVTLTYEYSVGLNTFTGTWTGFWPESGSPNALPADHLEELRSGQYPLMVQYDPEDPAQSSLHAEKGQMQHVYGGLAIVSCIATLAYCALVYPTWTRSAT